MDDLDHLFVQLVEILRERRPGRLTEAIALRDVHEDLIPYRRVRDPVGFGSNADYEAALSRLLAGEREYVLTEAQEMVSAVREGLAEAIPDLRRYRAYPEARLRINPERIPAPGDRRYAPPGLRHAEEPPRSTYEPPDETWGDDPAALFSERVSAAPAEPIAASDPERTGAETDPAEAAEAAAKVSAEEDGADRQLSCRGCGAALPDREIRFCPFCGGRLDPELCAGCGSGLEPEWRFCPDCGRDRWAEA